jgi:hypothetical protein
MFYEFDLLESKLTYNANLFIEEIQRIKSNHNRGETHASITAGEIESHRQDVREVKLKLEKLNDEVAHKSNIKDVCALIDLKANIEDVDKSF